MADTTEGLIASISVFVLPFDGRRTVRDSPGLPQPGTPVKSSWVFCRIISFKKVMTWGELRGIPCRIWRNSRVSAVKDPPL